MTQVIAEKEKKSSSYKESRLESLSDEKVSKIKKFSKDYIAKVLHKLEKSSKRPKHSGSSTKDATPSSSMIMDTPNSNDGGEGTEGVAGDSGMQMSVEEAMGMDHDDDDIDSDTDDEEQQPEAPSGSSPKKSTEEHTGQAESTMDVDSHVGTNDPSPISDPKTNMEE